jgi:hypothetical protein
MPTIRTLGILGLALIVGCGRQAVQEPAEKATLVPKGKAIKPVSPDSLTQRFSTDVLPSGKEFLARPVRPGDAPIVLAHDTPLMDQVARGPFSFIGAAREFNAISGVPIPDWVSPESGHYRVGHRSDGFVCQSSLSYRIDPSRRDELIQLVKDAFRKHRSKELVLFREGDTRVMGAKQVDGGIRLYDMTIVIGDDGIIRLFNTRGPED